jgi:carboxymethylenebutenolidase
MAALGSVPTSRLVADLKSGVTELRRRLPGRKLAATGFCFGGGMTWLLLASGEPRLAAAAPFYGPFPDSGDLSRSKAALLGIYAELDARVNASRDAARAALRRARLRHRIVTFPGADHAFFNNTGPRYNPTAAGSAYRQVLAWFRQYLA